MIILFFGEIFSVTVKRWTAPITLPATGGTGQADTGRKTVLPAVEPAVINWCAEAKHQRTASNSGINL